MRRRKSSPDTPEIQIAPMIDCVFLMLVYFMTTSSLEKSEADLAFPAGRAGAAADPLPAVDEQQLEVDAAGAVSWNGSSFPLLAGGSAGLLERLHAFRGTCAAAGSTPSLRLVPDPEAPHQAVVTLLDLISDSGIETVHFP